MQKRQVHIITLSLLVGALFGGVIGNLFALILPESVVEQFVGPSDETTKISGVDRQRECRVILEQERLQALAVYARRYGTNWLVGIDKQEISPIFPSGTRNFNCGLFLDPDGKVRLLEIPNDTLLGSTIA